ncbi:hypothetical protein M5K25_002205 [Dendrobium thyrsiflorum]|uniref:Uncharacterized protein n=1 Tax=Dendrobium thyrsiflorum TaxID=117978 RepID=A0ABD0VS35_DENTH
MAELLYCFNGEVDEDLSCQDLAFFFKVRQPGIEMGTPLLIHRNSEQCEHTLTQANIRLLSIGSRVGFKVLFHCLDAIDETFFGLLDVLSNINASNGLVCRQHLNNGAISLWLNLDVRSCRLDLAAQISTLNNRNGRCSCSAVWLSFYTGFDGEVDEDMLYKLQRMFTLAALAIINLIGNNEHWPWSH